MSKKIKNDPRSFSLESLSQGRNQNNGILWLFSKIYSAARSAAGKVSNFAAINLQEHVVFFLSHLVISLPSSQITFNSLLQLLEIAEGHKWLKSL